MKQFVGFPAKMDFTPLPNLFFSQLLPGINDLAELKATLHVFAAVYRKKGSPQFASFKELLGNVSLMESLRGMDNPPEEALRQALDAATRRGTVLHVELGDGENEDIYLINNDASRQALAKIQSGEIKLGGLKATTPEPVPAEPPPDIFTLYEQNIGMLTPMIAEELREAEKLYPLDWIHDAIKEAVALNKWNIRYITRILERWSTEGKTDGTHQRYPKTGPDKYVKGKYGHMVQR
jgi:DnaD/phage-associated family protein